MLIPTLMGGLGNLMFQLASTYSIAKRTCHQFAICCDMPITSGHSKIDYSAGVLSQWLPYRIDTPRIHGTLHELNLHPLDIDYISKLVDKNIRLVGYFQNYNYVLPETLGMFNLPEVPDRYDYDDAYFLHVRRGDYLKIPLHNVNLQHYYEEAVRMMPAHSIMSIVSNDMPWCESWEYLQDRRVQFIKEDEVTSLSIMKSCRHGGIAANSSFSWWGLYLDNSRKHMYFPDKWFNNNGFYTEGFYFPGSIKLCT